MAVDTYLTIGGYTFSGFGVPERINGGGQHHLIVHKLIGGQRIIDAMGPDDDSIKFTGRFRNADGTDAMSQAILLDAMRRAGKPVPLTYWNQTATVVIKHFGWSFERFFEVPYTIECEVVTASGQAGPQAAATQDGAITGDATLNNTLTVGSDAATAAIAQFNSAYSTYGPIANATQQAAALINQAAQNSKDALAALAALADVQGHPAGSVVAGGNPQTMADVAVQEALTQTNGAAAQLALPVQQSINQNLNPPGGAAQ